MRRIITYIFVLLLVYSTAYSQVNTFIAQQGLITSLQSQLNQLQQQINGLILPPGATPGQFVVENASGTAYVAATISGDVSASVSTPGLLTVNKSSATNFNVTNLTGNWIGEIDPCQHGLACNAQFDNAVTANNGSPTIVISGTQGGSFSSGSVGQVIKVIDPTTGQDGFMGTIATFISSSSVTLSGNYTGTNTTSGKAVWGTGDATGFNTTLQNFIGTTAAGVWYPRIVHCHAPILADSQLTWNVLDAEFQGTGRWSQMVSSTNQDQNGCIIIDMNPHNGTAATDILQVQGNLGARFHDFNMDGSTLFPKRAFITISQAGGRNSSENVFYNINAGVGTGIVAPTTWGLTATCVPAGNISAGSITCGSAPTGLNAGQRIYIVDEVTGWEEPYVASISGNTINLAASLLATHINGNFTVFYDPDPVALDMFYIDSASAQTDTNTFQQVQGDKVDTVWDSRQQQSIGNVIDSLVCQNDSVCVAESGGDATGRMIQQNNTSIGWILDRSSRLIVDGWEVQPSASGIAPGTYILGACGNTSTAPTCDFEARYVQWPTESNAPAAGQFIVTGPFTFKGAFRIDDLQIFGSSSGAPLPAQQNPVIQITLGSPASAFQNFNTNINYTTSPGNGALDLIYTEVGSPASATERHVRLCPIGWNQTGGRTACTDQMLLGSDTFQLFRTDIAGETQTWNLQVPQLTTVTPTGLTCSNPATPTTWDYFATLCGDPSCATETVASGAQAVTCNNTIDSTHTVAGTVTVPKGTAAVRIYRSAAGGGVASASTLQYTIATNQSVALSSGTPNKVGFLDNGGGVGSGHPPLTNTTGQISTGGVVSGGAGVVNGCSWTCTMVAGVCATAVPCLGQFSNVAITGVSGGGAATTLATPANTPAVISCAQPSAKATSVNCLASTANATPVVSGIGY